MDIRKEIRTIIRESLEGNVWYHGTPDVRELEKDGGFTKKYLDIEYADDIEGYDKIQGDLKIARESGNEDEYFRLLDSVGDYKKIVKIKKPIFLSDSYSVASTYADPKRAFDYQVAEEKVLKVKLKPGKTVIINATGDRFRFVDINKVRRGFLNAGVDEVELNLMIRKLNFALGIKSGIKTDDIAALGDWFGFDYIDVTGVLDSYQGGSIKSTVRMVFNPSNITIIKKEVSEIKNIVREVISETMETGFDAYHGSEHKISKFEDSFLSGDGVTQHHGAGIYFTTNYDNARMFGENVYKVHIKGRFLDRETPAENVSIEELIKLMKMSDEDWEMEAYNYNEDPEVGVMIAAQSAIDYADNEVDVFLRVQSSWYQHQPLDYVRNMTKLGYDGMVVDAPKDWVGEKHIIVFNPNIISKEK